MLNESIYKEIFNNIIQSKIQRYGLRATKIINQIHSIKVDKECNIKSLNNTPKNTYKEILEVFEQLR